MYHAPLEASPPAYRHSFCTHCGSPLSLDDPPPLRPAYQQFTEQCLRWLDGVPALPRHERAAPLAAKVLRAHFNP